MECEPLPTEARRVFEWIAKHVESKVCFWFSEVKRDCDIATDHELHTLLTTLQQYPKRVGWHGSIVKAIYPEEEHREGAFEVSAHADRAWARYQSWEQDVVCPICRAAALKKVAVLRCPKCGHEHDAPRQ